MFFELCGRGVLKAVQEAVDGGGYTCTPTKVGSAELSINLCGPTLKEGVCLRGVCVLKRVS